MFGWRRYFNYVSSSVHRNEKIHKTRDAREFSKIDYNFRQTPKYSKIMNITNTFVGLSVVSLVARGLSIFIDTQAIFSFPSYHLFKGLFFGSSLSLSYWRIFQWECQFDYISPQWKKWKIVKNSNRLWNHSLNVFASKLEYKQTLVLRMWKWRTRAWLSVFV